MIDITNEKLITLTEAARLVPSARHGKAAHVSTVMRWVRRGSRGRRLDALRVGGSWFTTVEALARFAEASPAGDAEDPPRPTLQRRAVEQKLDALGL